MREIDVQPNESMSPLESRLHSWQPSRGNLDRDRMLYEAGRASAFAGARSPLVRSLWPLATSFAVIMALGLGLAWQYERVRSRGLELTFAWDVESHRKIESALAASKADAVPVSMSEITRTPDAIDHTSYLALTRRIVILEEGDPAIPPEGQAPRNRLPRPADARAEPLKARDLVRVIPL